MLVHWGSFEHQPHRIFLAGLGPGSGQKLRQLLLRTTGILLIDAAGVFAFDTARRHLLDGKRGLPEDRFLNPRCSNSPRQRPTSTLT